MFPLRADLSLKGAHHPEKQTGHKSYLPVKKQKKLGGIPIHCVNWPGLYSYGYINMVGWVGYHTAISDALYQIQRQ